MRREPADTFLITGASGYLGSLVAAAVAADSSARLVLLIRSQRDSASVVARIVEEAIRINPVQGEDAAARITVIPMAEPFGSAGIVNAVRELNITQILHCAGSLSYWNLEKLKAGNDQLTRELLNAAKELGVRRFIHLSSAFCSGYMDTVAGEEFHSSPGSDPCPYTSSKRDSEILVATSGLPYVIVRPSIVIGDSRDGRYTGKLSGVYQFWWAAQRYLFGRASVIHAVCPDTPLHVVHQDAFQAGFVGAYHHSPENSIIHLVSREETLPTVRQLWSSFIARYAPDSEVCYHDDVESIPMAECDHNVQQLLAAVRTNMEICGHPWRFDSSSLDAVRSKGVFFADATLASVERCQNLFLSTSAQAHKYSC